MEKTLPEKLREYARCNLKRLPDHFEFFGIPEGCDNMYDWMADEIERCYIPRPRFEDGEPIQWDGEFDNGCGVSTLVNLMVGKDGDYYLNDYVESPDIALDPGEFVKRPTPKVYDADGVEIKIGDTVYAVDGTTKGEVTKLDGTDGLNVRIYDGLDAIWQMSNKLTHEKPVFDAEGVRICKGDTVWHKDGTKYEVIGIRSEKHIDLETIHDGRNWRADFASDELFHQEPDSYEKVSDYIEAIIEDLENRHFDKEWVDELKEANNRLTALIERGEK